MTHWLALGHQAILSGLRLVPQPLLVQVQAETQTVGMQQGGGDRAAGFSFLATPTVIAHSSHLLMPLSPLPPGPTAWPSQLIHHIPTVRGARRLVGSSWINY